MAETATIPRKRLRELEELEKNVPALIQAAIEKAIAEYKMERLRRLRERDRADVNLVRERARRYAEKHRESINARRRLKRHPEEEVTTNLLMIRDAPQENLETDRPRTDDREPKEGDVVPSSVGPISLEGASHEHSETPQPKRKRRPKKVDKE